MRIVDAHLLEEKMDEAVTHYINTHQGGGEGVHIDSNGMAIHDDGGRVVTVMHQSYSHMSRQVSVGEPVEGGQWGEELLDPDERLAALVAHLAHQSRSQHHNAHHKISSMRGDVDTILDTPLRLFNGHAQSLESQQSSIEISVPPLTPLPPLPPLQGMKRCPDNSWFTKTKATLKENAMLSDSEVLELGAGASPAQTKHSKKSLPHKKRISRKLKRNNGSCTPQQDIVVLNCSEDVHHEEILPDSLVSGQHPDHLPSEAQHIAHEMRAILICQLCGEFYGEEQLKFYQHLKQHYEPHATIIIENPMNSSCIVDNAASLPDSLVELSLEGAAPKAGYHHHQQQQPAHAHAPHADKHALYSGDKALYTNNKVQYCMSGMEKEPDKADLYDSLDKLELYSCGKCNKSFRKQKHCEQHIKEAHANKLEDMGEFSEPEDLMEGIHVAVEEGAEPEPEPYDTLLPHLTVDNGHVHQEHGRHWYLRGGEGAPPCGGPAGYCPVCPRPTLPAHPSHPSHPAHPAHPTHPANPTPRQPTPEPSHLKEEEIQRIFEGEVGFAGRIVPESELPQPQQPTQDIVTTTSAPSAPGPPVPPAAPASTPDDKKKVKKFECPECGRVFHHRNSLLYHVLSHSAKREACKECGKHFYTPAALKVHKRVHNGDRPYKCEECGREFRQWSDLKYHKVSLHSNQKHFKCEFCGKEFARKYSLNVHRRIHTGERNYKCEYCTKTFRASSYRLSHMRTHTGDRPYKCTSCDKCFRVAGDLRRHMIVHEKVRNRLDQKATAPKDKRKPKDEPKVEPDDEKITIEVPSRIKKIATASTTRPPILKNIGKNNKPKTTKKTTQIKVEFDTPNVTVTLTHNKSEPLKANTEYADADVLETRPVEYSKFKEMYSESTYKQASCEPVLEDKEGEQRLTEEKELAVLRPMFRSGACAASERPAPSRENTDGKMQVFTHVVDKADSITLADIRTLERERDARGESGTEEHGFLERLTFLYNIPAV